MFQPQLNNGCFFSLLASLRRLIVINAWFASGNMPSALKAFKEMRFMGYSPDIITYNTLVNGFAQTGDLLKSRAMIGARAER